LNEVLIVMFHTGSVRFLFINMFSSILRTDV